MNPRTIGLSEEDRPIQVTVFGKRSAPLRVLIFAGQHGDEGQASKALRTFCQQANHLADSVTQVAIIADLNPDGAARHTRLNAHGVDLNRDHQCLASAETHTLHRFVRTWRPQLIIDMHTYPPRRKHLLAQDLIYCHDVFIDVPTNPSLHAPPLERAAERLVPEITTALNIRGFLSERYTLIRRSGRMRHSSADIVDARNALALRYGALGIILEGRESLRSDPPGARDWVQTAMITALHLVLQWAQQNRDLLTAGPQPRQRGQHVVVRSTYERASQPLRMLFRETQSGRIRQIELPGLFTPKIKPTEWVQLPGAYAVPRSHTNLLEVLRAHGFASHAPNPGMTYWVERYRVTDVNPSQRPRRAPYEISTMRSYTWQPLDDYVIFPVTEDGGNALAVFLEPMSKYGLLRFSDLKITVQSGTTYPILRLGSGV